MTDSDFEKLGITSMGIKLKIKQACRNRKKGNCILILCIFKISK